MTDDIAALAVPEASVAAFAHADHPFSIEMIAVTGQLARRPAGRGGAGVPLLLFNGRPNEPIRNFWVNN